MDPQKLQEVIKEKLIKYDLSKNVELNNNASAYRIKFYKKEVVILVTIPISVFEIFFDATNATNTINIKDSWESYGEKRDEDYRSFLEHIFSVLTQNDIRISENKKNIEYKDVDWKYFFGHKI
jgi:hypothetical protein